MQLNFPHMNSILSFSIASWLLRPSTGGRQDRYDPNIYSDSGGGYPLGIPPSNCEGLWIKPLNKSGISHPRCNCTNSSISCINLQMRPTPIMSESDKLDDPDFFLQIEDHRFSDLHSITIHGNNLEQLPAHLFGPGVEHEKLTWLNLSANYFIHTDANAFRGLPRLTVLDLSDNEIVMLKNQTDLFKPLPNLQKLYLIKAFNYGQNKTTQLDNVEEVLRRANLRHLTHLILDNNFFTYIPPKIGCILPNLQWFSFARNPVQRWENVDTGCFRKTGKLEILDLSETGVSYLGENFTDFVDSLPAKSRIRLKHSKLECTCRLRHLIVWLNTTNRVMDLPKVTCLRASPREFVGYPVYMLNPDDLDCSLNGGLSIYHRGALGGGVDSFSLFITLFLIFIHCLT